MASMNNDLQNPDFSNKFPIRVLTNKIRFYNTKTFCNTILCSYLGHELKLFIMLWKHNSAFETGVNLTQTLLKIQFIKAPRHFCRNWLLQGLPPPLEKQPQHLVTPCETGSPAISCYFILMCCFLSWHISSLWYLLMPREKGLKPLLKMRRKEVTDRLLFVFSIASPNGWAKSALNLEAARTRDLKT